LRVAALAFGVLAGLVASLILALGGLDVAADLGATADRQAQAIRFGLFVIGNLGIFGAALVLAAPLAGGVFLILGAVAWVGAALLMHHTTDLVLIVPPAILLVAAVFAVIAHVRRPRRAEPDEDDETESEAEIIPPLRSERVAPPPELDDTDDEEQVGIPAFAAEQRHEPGARGSAFDEERGRVPGVEWNPRKRQPPPPRARAPFRPVEDEYEDEPSGFSRFALGFSGVLSFGLYAALAGAAVLVFWTLRTDPTPPAVTVAEVPASSASVEPVVPASSEEARLPSQEATLEPILTAAPISEVETEGAAPSATPSELVADAAPSTEPGTFGAVTMPSGPVGVPVLSDDFVSEDEAVALPPVSAAPPALPSAEALPPAEPEVPDPEAAPPEPTVPAAGQPWPVAVPPALAAQRLAPGTGPTAVVVRLPSNSNNTGL
jgi:hypothetical protein